MLQAEIDDLDAQLTSLVTAGDNPTRLRAERSFARLCGVAPIPASSGRTGRHRLHRGGDRNANSALWRIALVRMHCHQPTKDFDVCRTAAPCDRYRPGPGTPSRR